MVYRFIILSDEVENFRRDITIDSEATFLDLHNAILDSVGYDKDQMTSFFICNEDWEKEKEVTLVEMDAFSEEDNYVMDRVRLRELLEDEKQKLVYVFDIFNERSFYMELREVIPAKNQEKAKVVRSEGKAPEQIFQLDESDLIASAAATSMLMDDDDLFDDELNLDEYDDEDFGNLMDDNNNW